MIKIEYANDLSTQRVIAATLSVSEVRDIFAASGSEVDYICHALYTHIRSKVGKRKNFYLQGGSANEIDKFERSKFCYYTLHEAEMYMPELFKMSYQVMSWLQKENDFGVGYVYSDLSRIEKFDSEYMKLRLDGGFVADVTKYDARVKLLDEMVSRGASDLKLRIMYI
jgi:hypothetical protein